MIYHISNKLILICTGLEQNSVKMTSSAKFIDYFVHDILDYTVLTNDSHNFIKNNTIFDVREAIQEIYQILEDKVAMKGIIVNFDYSSLRSDFII